MSAPSKTNGPGLEEQWAHGLISCSANVPPQTAESIWVFLSHKVIICGYAVMLKDATLISKAVLSRW